MSDNARVLQRVRDLLALAASPNDEEARSSAWLAAKLIREHRLEVVAKQPVEAAAYLESIRPSRPSRPPRKVATGKPTRNIFRGTCAHCHQPTIVGEMVATCVLHPGTPFTVGVVHAECADLWHAPAST